MTFENIIDFRKHTPALPSEVIRDSSVNVELILQIILLISLSDVIKKNITSVRKQTFSDTTLSHTVLQRHHWNCNYFFCHCLTLLKVVQKTYSILFGVLIKQALQYSLSGWALHGQNSEPGHKDYWRLFSALVTACFNSFPLADNPTN